MQRMHDTAIYIRDKKVLDINEIVRLHITAVEEWHSQDISNQYKDPLLHLICENHKYNFLLWHEEDIARSPNASDKIIADVKRKIDKYNQKRNDFIEAIDECLLDILSTLEIIPDKDAKLNTETPGSAIDRLSILAIRIYHMIEQKNRRDAPSVRKKAEERLGVLYHQQQDLVMALTDLLREIFNGKKILKIYRQFKMYNDPEMNPYLYNPQIINERRYV